MVTNTTKNGGRNRNAREEPLVMEVEHTADTGGTNHNQNRARIKPQINDSG